MHLCVKNNVDYEVTLKMEIVFSSCIVVWNKNVIFQKVTIKMELCSPVALLCEVKLWFSIEVIQKTWLCALVSLLFEIRLWFSEILHYKCICVLLLHCCVKWDCNFHSCHITNVFLFSRCIVLWKWLWFSIEVTLKMELRSPVALLYEIRLWFS